MPNSNTKIQVKRSDKTKLQLEQTQEPLLFGEPVFIEKENIGVKHKYLAIGNNETVDEATYFEGITNPNYVGKTVYADSNNNIVLQDGTFVNATRLSPTELNIPLNNDTKYYVVSYANNSNNQSNTYIHNDNVNNRGVYITGKGVLNGGAWNDYAENRKCVLGAPGHVVCENGYGELELSSYKLQALPYVISDTHGMCIGPEGEQYKPVALSGRVLVYTKEKDLKVGDVLCAGKNGYAERMTRQEIINYPDRILGVVSEIPTYPIWNDVEINGRIWITIK